MNINRRVFTSLIALSIAPSFLRPQKAIAAGAKTREYSLIINREMVNLTGRWHSKITVNGTIPGPTLYFTEGEEAIIHVTNNMANETSVHWHGLLVPKDMDGAPGFNGILPIGAGATFTYRFTIRQSGTYWYHAHTGGQEQDGLYGGIVIAPKEPDNIAADRDYVILLSDYSSESSEQILGHLKMSSDYYQNRRRTLGDFVRDAKSDGLSAASRRAKEWGKMRMLRTDLSDVSGYHFLVNGKDNTGNWTGLFNPNERVRLRFINASAMTMYDMRIPGLLMKIIAADGQMVEDVLVDEFRFGNGETFDVIVTPTADKAYMIIAESIDREGFALGTLAPRLGMTAPIPKHRPRAQLTMGDMNMEVMMKDDPEMDMSNPEIGGWSQNFAPEGARTLSYDDLVFKGEQGDIREPTRNLEIRLGGNMERYIWTLNGKTFDPEDGIDCTYNERVRIIYINETMMAHPLHLHGMFVQYENGQSAQKMPNKHTIIVPPGRTASAIITANEIGDWPLHCHLFYHMASGMMTTFRVRADAGTPHKPSTNGANHGHH